MASDYAPSENLNPLSPNGIALAKGKKVAAYPRVRPTAEEQTKRLQFCVDLLSQCMEVSEIKRLFADTFKTASRGAEVYICRASKMLAALGMRPLDEWKNGSIALYARQSFDVTLSAKDRREARRALDTLLGLNAATGIKIEDLDRLIDLEQQRIAGQGQLTDGSVEGELVTDGVTPITLEVNDDVS